MLKWVLLAAVVSMGSWVLFATVAPPSSLLRALGFVAPSVDGLGDTLDDEGPRIVRSPPLPSAPAPRSGSPRVIDVDTLEDEEPRIVRGPPDRSVPAPWSGPARVIDGDTLEVEGARIRLHGIDAPESAQSCRTAGRDWPCGREATRALSGRIGGAPVACEERDRDRYGRIVAVCRNSGRDINAWLVREGWALAYRRYSLEYVDEEAAAKSACRGIWRGAFVPPWAWRQGTRLATGERQAACGGQPVARDRQPERAASVRGACNIKGNVSYNGGRRLYHMPGDPNYARTRISPSRGERWFCSEAEARAAGWRRARR